MVPPRNANPVGINKGTATARTIEEVCAIQFVKGFLHTSVEKQTSRELFLFAISGRMRTASSLARVPSETRRRRDFSQERSIKIKSLKSGALLSQGRKRCFIDDSHPSLCTVFYPHQWKFLSRGNVGPVGQF